MPNKPNPNEEAGDSVVEKDLNFNQKLQTVINFLKGLKITLDNGTEITFNNEDLKAIEKHFTNIGLNIFSQKITNSPEEFTSKFKKNLENLQISAEKWKNCVVKRPQLFYQSPETINSNITRASELLEITKQSYIEAVLKQPPLFSQSPETINSNITQAANLLNIEKQKYIEAALKQPSLFSQSPETINSNITQAANLLNIEKQKYIEAALKQPSLFYQSPETIKTKFDLYNLFVNQQQDKILNYLLRNCILFSYAPERIMAFYVLAKLNNQEMNLNTLSKNPLTLAKKQLSNQNLQTFMILYDYFKNLFEQRRRIKRRISKEAEKEAQTTLKHAKVIIEYFGPKDQIGLTPEQLQKIQELKQKVETHLYKN